MLQRCVILQQFLVREVHVDSLLALKLHKLLRSNENSVSRVAAEFVYFISNLSDEHDHRPFENPKLYVRSNQLLKSTHTKQALDKLHELFSEIANNTPYFLYNEVFLKDPLQFVVMGLDNKDVKLVANLVDKVTKDENKEPKSKNAQEEKQDTSSLSKDDGSNSKDAPNKQPLVAPNKQHSSMVVRKEEKLKVVQMGMDLEDLKFSFKAGKNNNTHSLVGSNNVIPNQKEQVVSKEASVSNPSASTTSNPDSNKSAASSIAIQQINQQSSVTQNTNEVSNHTTNTNSINKKNNLPIEEEEEYTEEDTEEEKRRIEEEKRAKKRERIKLQKQKLKQARSAMGFANKDTKKTNKDTIQFPHQNSVDVKNENSHETKDKQSIVEKQANNCHYSIKMGKDSPFDLIKSIPERIIKLMSDLHDECKTLARAKYLKKLQLDAAERKFKDFHRKAAAEISEQLHRNSEDLITMLATEDYSLQNQCTDGLVQMSDIIQKHNQADSEKKSLELDVKNKKDDYEDAKYKYDEYMELQVQLMNMRADSVIATLEKHISESKSPSHKSLSLPEEKIQEIADTVKRLETKHLGHKHAMLGLIQNVNALNKIITISHTHEK